MGLPARTDETRYYMVRPMKGTSEDHRVFFEDDVVAVGWSRVDFTDFEDPDQVAKEVEEAYYSDGETAASVVGKKKNEVKRFKRLQRGDRIVVPRGRSVCLAIASGEASYKPNAGGTWTMANQHHVEYRHDEEGLLRIPRSDLSNALQSRLRVPGSTVSNLSEFADEIEQLLQEAGGWSSLDARAEEEKVARFTEELTKRLREGSVALKGGGRGLEELVAELLELEGYQAQILSKRDFDGKADADVRGIRSDRFLETTLLVQVKQHRGTTGTHGVEQLTELRRLHDEEAGAELALVTTASASEDLEEACEREDIVLLSGRDIAEWVYERLEGLSTETRRKLGVSEVPEFLPR